MNAAEYLERIGYHGPREPTAEVLFQVHKHHLHSVPFENLDISLGKPIELALPSLFEKIVVRRRGGICYELNTLFAWLLRELGFSVHQLSGRVFNDGVAGPEFDHMLLLLEEGERIIADVGFGDSFLEPVFLGAREQIQYGFSYRMVDQSDDWVLQRRTPGADWISQYAFSLKPRQTDDFNSMCLYHQTSADSIFTRKSVCSLATRDGRISLANDRFVVTDGRHRQEEVISSLEEYRALLRERFGIDLGDEGDKENALARVRDDAKPGRPS
jgi:N-hydroxyarylamine O-acetyltransferase